ncbi:MAG: VOC family protein [Deltaproteobacteria bacterium]|nr:VOC family protein [Deltaproteobacteria bacterium]
MGGDDPACAKPGDRPPAAGAGRVHHVALRTDDVAALAAFYSEVFGLEIVRDSNTTSIWLSIGEGSVLMIEKRDPSEPAICAGSMEMFALAATPERKAAIRARAERRGCLDGETEHTVYLRDPDGRRVGASSYPLVFPG